MVEIERKFLVTSEAFKNEAQKYARITQGYLNSDKARAVRVRLKEDQGFLTIKGDSSDGGLSRFEWEKEITKEDAKALLKICETGLIDKIRYDVPVGNHLFEVDEFFGDSEGLIIAEVELNHISEVFEKPKWLGVEVTGDSKYYNSQLTKQPFKTWK